MSKYPRWKYILLVVVLAIGVLYALPNLFGDTPAVQVSPHTGYALDHAVEAKIQQALAERHIPYQSMTISDQSLFIRFKTTDNQINANDVIKQALGDNYTVALNLASNTPVWLAAIGAHPMKLGLDLQGGVHFLFAVDMNSLLEHRTSGYMRNISDELRSQRIRYSGLMRTNDNVISMQFRDPKDMEKAAQWIGTQLPDLLVETKTTDGQNQLTATLTPAAILAAQNTAIEQTTTILRNRINLLGVAEPIVQRQGADRIAVDLPGVQDTAHAKQIVGGTATIEFHLVDDKDSAQQALSSHPPAGTSVYYTQDGQPILLQNQVVLSGASITNATSTYGEDGRPSVSITLGGGGEANFYKVTKENIGHPLAIVYIETNMTASTENGKTTYIPHTTQKVISYPIINSALPSTFQVTGLQDPNEARNLALLLRAGALPTAISIIEESIVGPSLGKENIKMGIFSVEIGFFAIVLFMICYYRGFGLIADAALLMNLILLIAAQSILGATLTLPSIAAIVLTLGMAVDANVLIFERIREELRYGVSPHASIEAGFEKAFATIVDANVTTLIAAIALFGIGTGAVKGFAITLTLGILTSMFTAIMGTRAIVHLVYDRKRQIKKLSIGI